MTQLPLAGPKALKVINLFAGPGAGKSTLAAGLFNIMKHHDFEVELVTEFAKDTTYEKNFGTLTNQLVILAEQDRRLRRLVGQVEWAVTDSPLPIGLAYMTPEYTEWLTPAVWGAFRRYRNYHVLVERGDRRFQTYGRNQTREEAVELDCSIEGIYVEAALGAGPPYEHRRVPSDNAAPYTVFEWLKMRRP